MNLYKAYSIVADPDYGKICYHWYISERPIEFERPYENLIEDYNKIACNDLFYIEDMIDEFFDADEFKDLQAFLQESFNTELVSTFYACYFGCHSNPWRTCGGNNSGFTIFG